MVCGVDVRFEAEHVELEVEENPCCIKSLHRLEFGDRSARVR